MMLKLVGRSHYTDLLNLDREDLAQEYQQSTPPQIEGSLIFSGARYHYPLQLPPSEDP